MLQRRIEKNKTPIDYDNFGGFQCMDLVRAWWKYAKLPQAKGLGWKGVKYLAIQDKKYLVKGQEFIKNTPTNFPKEGDAIVFSQPSLTGHIAIVVDATVNWVKIYEQNAGRGGGMGVGIDAPRITTTNYKNVMGRIRGTIA